MKQIAPELEDGVKVIPFEIRTLGGMFKTWTRGPRTFADPPLRVPEAATANF
jgi:hypothetical protein